MNQGVMKLPAEAQEGFMQMQMFQQQMQQIGMQREQMKYQKIEAEKALEEMSGLDDSAEVFKAVGPILIKSKKSDLEKELKEKMETADVRLKKLDSEEEKIKEDLQKVQTKLQEILKPAEDKPQEAG